MQPFLAYIVPVVSGDAHPEHPIVIPPTRPPGGPVDPGYGYPQYPVDPGYGIPGPPYPGGPGKPPGIWGGGNEPFPTPPIVIPPDKPGMWPPPHPAHPIVIPPTDEKPPTGGESGSITNPINLPPNSLAEVSHGFWQQAFFPELGGWLWTWVVVEVEKAGRKR